MMICHSAVQYVGVESMLHMTCVGSTKEVSNSKYSICNILSHQNVSGYLEKAKSKGIRNILALRGDLPSMDDEWQVERGAPSTHQPCPVRPREVQLRHRPGEAHQEDH